MMMGTFISRDSRPLLLLKCLEKIKMINCLKNHNFKDIGNLGEQRGLDELELERKQPYLDELKLPIISFPQGIC